MNQYLQQKSTSVDAESCVSPDGSQTCTLNVETSENLIPALGKDEWIASQRASLVRIFHVLAQAMESMVKGPVSSGSCSEQLMLLSHQSSSLKTPQESEPGVARKSSALLWRKDIPGETERLRPLMSVRAIKEIGGGALLPTLTVCGNWNRKGASQNSGDGLATALRRLPTLTARDYKNSGGKKLTQRGKNRLPTLLKSDGNRGPTKAERTDTGGPSLHAALRRLQKQLSVSGTSPEYTTGYRLTPEFAEWWMGWPIRWTALKPVETGKSRFKRR